jgi:hypothetical protein
MKARPVKRLIPGLAGESAMRAALRCGAAALLMVAIHFVAARAALSGHETEATPNASAVMIDLAPSRFLRQRPGGVASGAQMTEAQPIPPPDTPIPVDETPDPTPAEPQQTAQELKPDIPAPAQPQDARVPDRKAG